MSGTHSPILVLCSLSVFAVGCGKTAFGPKHAISTPDLATFWAEWIKDEGETFDALVVIRNTSTRRTLSFRATDFSCGKGTLGGQVRVLEADEMKAKARLSQSQQLKLILICTLPEKTKGGFKVSLHNIVDATTRQPLLDALTWASNPSARRFVAATPSKLAGPPPLVAVFDIRNRGTTFDAEMLGRLTEYLMTKLVSTDRYQVVPRAQLRARLSEQKKTSYKRCFDQSCQIDIGRELAAQKSLNTTVMRLGTRCVVNASLFDLKRVTGEKAGSAKGNCSEDGIVNTLDRVVGQLAGR